MLFGHFDGYGVRTTPLSPASRRCHLSSIQRRTKISRISPTFWSTIQKLHARCGCAVRFVAYFSSTDIADFSFVQDYLRQSVCSGISLEHKSRVLLRFFPVIASEGIEELKVLSIQSLVHPMLEHDFESVRVELSSADEQAAVSPAVKEVAMDMEDEIKHGVGKGEGADLSDSIMGVEGIEDTDGNVKSNLSPDFSNSKDKVDNGVGLTERVINKGLTSQFVADVFVNGSNHRTYGSRLSI